MIKKLVLLIIIIIGISFFSPVFAYDDCPFGLVQDPFPGECGRYIDTNGSGFCDHSETLAQNKTTPLDATTNTEVETDPNELITGQDLKTKTVQEVADLYRIDVQKFILGLNQMMEVTNITPATSFQLLHDNYGAEPSKIKGLASDLAAGKEINIEAMEKTPTQTKNVFQSSYNFGVLSAVVLSLYILSFILMKKKVYSILTHRMMWNMLLGTNFFITAVLGILLVLRIDHGIKIPLPINILFFHVEAGIIFALIAIFHIAWHYPYFKAMLYRKGK